jgi:ankyrin repeat protein
MINQRYKDGQDWTPLHHSCKNNNLEMIQLLLEEGKKQNVNIVSIKDKFGNAPLFCSKSSEAVQLFLSSGLEGLELENNNGEPLLHFCVRKDILTDSIWSSLESQWELVWRVKTPMDMGEN